MTRDRTEMDRIKRTLSVAYVVCLPGLEVGTRPHARGLMVKYVFHDITDARTGLAGDRQRPATPQIGETR